MRASDLHEIAQALHALKGGEYRFDVLRRCVIYRWIPAPAELELILRHFPEVRDEEQRIAALDILGLCQDAPRAMPAIIRALNDLPEMDDDPSRRVRCAGYRALGRLKDPASLPLLEEHLLRLLPQAEKRTICFLLEAIGGIGGEEAARVLCRVADQFIAQRLPFHGGKELCRELGRTGSLQAQQKLRQFMQAEHIRLSHRLYATVEALRILADEQTIESALRLLQDEAEGIAQDWEAKDWDELLVTTLLQAHPQGAELFGHLQHQQKT